MVGDPVSTNMNFESLTEQWESVEVYREARSRFIKGMDSLMSEYDDGQQDASIIYARAFIEFAPEPDCLEKILKCMKA